MQFGVKYLFTFHRGYLDWLGRVLHVQRLEGWYEISNQQVEDHGGVYLLQHYSNSLGRALQYVYPELGWQLWRFENSKESIDAHKKSLANLEKEFFVTNPTDWNFVTKEQVTSMEEGRFLLSDYGSLHEMLLAHYPTFSKDFQNWRDRISHKTQMFLYKSLNYSLEDNSSAEYDFSCKLSTYPESKQPMQFDVWIPSLNAAIEYQGIQHYVDTFLSGEKVSLRLFYCSH